MPRSTRLAFVFVWFLLFLAPGVGSFGQTKSSQSNTGSAPAAPSPLPAGPGRFTFDLGGHPQCATALFGDAAPALVDQLVRRRLEAGLLRETAVTEMRESNTPGAAIGVVHSGKLVLTCGFGVANVETGQPVTADTLFRLGSTTKMFTAALVVSQAHEGKVQLDQPIGRYLADTYSRLDRRVDHEWPPRRFRIGPGDPGNGRIVAIRRKRPRVQENCVVEAAAVVLRLRVKRAAPADLISHTFHLFHWGADAAPLAVGNPARVF